MKTNEEVNQIIAEFMGARIETVTSWDRKEPYSRLVDHNGSYKDLYIKSLDVCVPVMEKLGVEINNTSLFEGRWRVVLNWVDRVRYCNTDLNWFSAITLQEATAHALAEAIKELREGSEK